VQRSSGQHDNLARFPRSHLVKAAVESRLPRGIGVERFRDLLLNRVRGARTQSEIAKAPVQGFGYSVTELSGAGNARPNQGWGAPLSDNRRHDDGRWEWQVYFKSDTTPRFGGMGRERGRCGEKKRKKHRRLGRKQKLREYRPMKIATPSQAKPARQTIQR
jgi:hypothetical protein